MILKHSFIKKNLLLLSTLFLLYSCGSSGQQGPGARQQRVQSYPVLNLQPRSIELTKSYPATLEGQQTVEIRPRVQGYITKMKVDEGDVVHKGEVLFKVNSEQYEQNVRFANADVQAAKAAIKTAKDKVQRFKKLVEKDIVSNYQLQSAKNGLKSQEAKLAQAKASLENAQVNLGYTNVKSPTDGVIGNIPYRIGSLVSSTIQKPLTKVSSISKMYAYFSMSERELLTMAQNVADEGGNSTLQQRVAEIPPVNLRLPDDTIYGQEGKVRLASGLINSGTGSASFRAVFSNPKQILRSGGSGTVQIPYDQESAIVIPKKATYEVQNRRFVYTVSDSNKVKSTPISTMPISTKKLFVVKDGLSSGDSIVTAGMGGLKDDTPIKPKPMNADSLYQALTIKQQ